MLLQDVSVCIVLLYYMDIVACIVYGLVFVCSVLTYHAIAEGKLNDAAKNTQILSYYTPIVSRAMLRCTDRARQQQMARRHAVPQETKQRCTGNFSQQYMLLQDASFRVV